MMLKFYAYFKQSTDGICSCKRPGFWDIVGRAKYDAWKRLGEMPKEKAMECYVNELKKIVETMSYTDNVADFYGSINELENVNINDLALVAPETINRQKSDPSSPLNSRSHSRFNSRDGSPTRTPKNSYTDTSDEEYIDTVDVSPSFPNEIDSPMINKLSIHRTLFLLLKKKHSKETGKTKKIQYR